VPYPRRLEACLQPSLRRNGARREAASRGSLGETHPAATPGGLRRRHQAAAVREWIAEATHCVGG